jgi:hypothetical protein
MQVTESGGYHIFFRHHEGLRGSVNRIAPGVDVRADGNYVIHWCREGLPVANADKLEPWPEWLLAAALGLAKDKEHHRGLVHVGSGLATSTVGSVGWRPSATWGRNQALYNYACVYREIMAEGRAELTREEAVRLLMYAAGSKGSIKKRGREQCMATIFSGFGMVERKLGRNDPNHKITSCTILPDGAPIARRRE